MPVPEYSYDITTPVGQVRFHAADTNVAGGAAIWTDAELSYCLALAGNVPELAAARALRMAASDAAKLAIISKTDSTSTDLTKISSQLLENADALENQYITGGAIVSADAVFSTASGGGTIPGSMDVW